MDKFIASANKAAAIKDVEASFSSDKSDKRTAMISTEVRSKEDVESLDILLRRGMQEGQPDPCQRMI